MAKKRAVAIGVAAILAPCTILLCQKAGSPAAPCEAPSFFGMCDPYVPGIIVQIGQDDRVVVGTTWPSGPADQAGLCPGDTFESINGASIAGRELADIIKSIVSEKQKPMDLSIRRGDQVIKYHLERVKESQLAALSMEQFARLPIFPYGDRLVTVPITESPQEIHAFRQFEFDIGRRHGFKPADNHWVPLAADEGQFERLGAVLNDPLSSRAPRTAYLISTDYQPGFSALILEHPDQAIVYLVDPDSPAMQAGLLPGDEIVEVDGHSVAGLDPKQFTELVMKPDDHARSINLQIRRGTAEQTIKVETQKQRDLGYGFSAFGETMQAQKKPGEYLVGIVLVNPGNPQEMVVREVKYPSAAFAAGMHVGDLILSINGKPARQIAREQVQEILNATTPAPVRIDALRLGKKIHFQITPLTESQAEASIGRKMTAHGPASAKCTEAPIQQ